MTELYPGWTVEAVRALLFLRDWLLSALPEPSSDPVVQRQQIDAIVWSD